MDVEKLLTDLVRDEGLRLKPYRCTAGKLTIGIGRNIEDIGITHDEAMHLGRNDIARVVVELDGALPWWREMSERRQRALANMAFNLGLARLLKFKMMLGAMQRGDFAAAVREAESSAWFRQVGERGPRVVAAIREG